MKLNSSKPILTAGHPAQRGIALVITLIMLSVTLIMAVAFLAVANRERATVTITSDGVNARLAADSALAAAQAQIMANVLGSGGGLYNSALIVSTNYINYNGFVSGGVSPTNVNYDYYTNSSSPLSASDFEIMVGNLLYQPRAPVMLSTNEPDGRFYLDLNRNGFFDPTATNIVFFNSAGVSNTIPVSEIGDPQWIGVLQRPDAPHSADNQFIARYAFFAQPIGNGLDLNYIYNQVMNQGLATSDGFFRNQGVGSWEINLAAFLTDLDPNEWNPIGNQYLYQEWLGPTPVPANRNSGAGFDDARSLLSWRYGFNYLSLASAAFMFSNTASPFKMDYIDEYSDGPLQTNTANFDEFLQPDDISQPWAGADNTNRFFNLPTELFDSTKSSPNFVARLANAGTNTVLGQNPTDDRYAFYHLLQQMGTDSIEDNDGKLDLNYDNTDGHGNLVRGVQTNLAPWTAMAFFTNAADRMLRMYTTNWFQSNPSNYLATYYGIPGYNYFYIYTNSAGFGVVVTNDPTGFGLTNVPFFGMTNQIPAFGITDIPVYENSNFVYSSAINRVLQLAANIYDASTNSFYPSVFRPLFGKDVFGNVFITGYTNVDGFTDGISDIQLSTPFDVTTIAALSSTFTNVADNIYGVPWIVGAKKGFPNFNEFAFENTLAVTRRLQLTRIPAASGGNPTLLSTNQMYEMGYTTSLGIELWNSYASNYNGNVFIDLNEIASVTITNDDQNSNLLFQKTIATNIVIPVSPWPGAGANPWLAGNPNQFSFVITNLLGPVLTNSVYRSPYNPVFPAPGFVPTNFFDITTSPLLFESNSANGFYLPQFGILTTNRLQLCVLDLSNGIYHVIDYVHFAGPDSSYNVNSNLADGDTGLFGSAPFGTGVWDTNYYASSPAPNGLTYGILNQIKYSKPNGNTPATVPSEDGTWSRDPNSIPLGGTIAQQQAYFAAFFGHDNKYTSFDTTIYPNATNHDTSIDAPYSPTRYITEYITWQANDPLVHYLVNDINYSGPTNSTTLPQIGLNHYNVGDTIASLTGLNLGRMNDRYSPWKGNPHYPSVDTNDFNTAERDPLVMSSDNWDFPTNRYPTVGWLGRVHRGTPWQTVYLKATNILTTANGFGNNIWQAWTGDGNAFDASNSAPVQDARLFDLFTTALDDNASRGTLSVNQPNLAAWSALLSGVVVITNMTVDPLPTTPSPVNGFMVISPAGGDTSSAVWNIVNNITNGINATRTNLAIFPGGVFTHVGDILRVPMLTQQSPFIQLKATIGDTNHMDFDISDEVYEQIPQQVLGLLRVGSPRYVIYCYGQALRPAQDGVALDLTHNGLVTNYQVVAESAARAVVSVHPQVIYRLPAPPVTNYTTTVENYTPLTPN